MTLYKLIELIESKGGFLVGSRAWGGELPDSDYDYAIEFKHKEEILRIVDLDLDIINTVVSTTDEYEGARSIYLRIRENKINLCFLSRSMLQCWEEASEMMHKFPKDKIFNRQLRRYAFTMLVDMFAHLN